MDKIQIPELTLIAVSSIKIDETILALQKSYKDILFGSIKLITHERPEILPKEISFEECPKLDDINKYNHYVFIELGKHVKTSHCLLIQHDSWVLSPKLWDDDWLQYDYCGSPWEWKTNSYQTDYGEHVRVGNGGFSLRSKKLLDIPKKHNMYLKSEKGWKNEDGQICVYWRKELLDYGIKYAPVEIASKFSYENPVPENNFGKMKTFGFHKNLNTGNKR